MISPNFLPDVGYAVGVLVVVVAAVTTWANTKKKDKETDQDKAAADCSTAIHNLEATVNALGIQNKLQAEQITANQKDISRLEGVVSVTKDIPLQGIDESLRSLKDSNGEIVALLTTQLKREETVAARVAEVKTDLAAH
jgi:hypothetical protein